MTAYRITRALRLRVVWLAVLSAIALGLFISARPAWGKEAPGRLNVLLITADDLNWNSLGVTGCKIPGITPNLDKLAADGMRFLHGHVTIAVCQPCREVPDEGAVSGWQRDPGPGRCGSCDPSTTCC